MFKAYANYWKNSLNFTDKAKRSDYWWPYLINSLIYLIIYIFTMTLSIGPALKTYQNAINSGNTNTAYIRSTMQNALTSTGPVRIINVFALLVGLAILLPNMAIIVRRLRDTSLAGGWWLGIISGILSFIALAAAFIGFFSPSSTASTGLASISPYTIFSFFSGVYGIVVNIIFCALHSADEED